MKSMGKIPDGWLPYSPIGNQVQGTRFIAFKVPLRETFVDKLKFEDRFTVPILLERLPEVGLIIDLTQTLKYYDKNEVLDRGVDYVKIPTPGQAVPAQQYVDRFFEVVDYYLDSHKKDDTLIGVHCTHGVNRTGYMICRYLIQRLGFTFEEAVEAVGSARGHMIERSHYLSSLRNHRTTVEKKITRGDLEEGKSKMQKKSIPVGKSPKKISETRSSALQGKEKLVRRENPNVGPPRGRSRSPIRDERRGFPQRDHHQEGGSQFNEGASYHGRGRSPIPPHHFRGHSPPHHVRGRSPPNPGGYRPPQGNDREWSPDDSAQPYMDRPPGRRPSPAPPQMRGRTPPHLRRRSPPAQMRGRTPPPQMRGGRASPYTRGYSPPPHMRGRTPPPPQMRGGSPPPHMRGRTPPHMRGRTPPHFRGGTPPHFRGPPVPPHMRGRTPPPHMRGHSPPPPPHMRGRSPPPHMRGRTSPPHLRGRSPPPHMRGRTPPPHMRGRTPPPHMRGRTPPPHMRGRTPPPHMRGRTPPPHMRGRSPPPYPRDHMPPPQMRGNSPPLAARGGPIRRSPSGPMRGRTPPHMRGRSPPPPHHMPPDVVMETASMRGRSPRPYPGRGRSPPLIEMSGGFPKRDFGRVRSPPRGREAPPGAGSGASGPINRREGYPGGRGSPGPSFRREPGRFRSPPSPGRPSNDVPPFYNKEFDGRRPPPARSPNYRKQPDFDRPPSYGDEAGRPADYYPEPYVPERRDRSPPMKEVASYPERRKDQSPPKDVRRRRKSPGGVRDKPGPSYPNGREAGPSSSRAAIPKGDWNCPPPPDDGPDCREILNERRSNKEPAYPPEREFDDRKRSLIERLPPKNVDLRESLEEEKRRKYLEAGVEEYGGVERKKPKRDFMDPEDYERRRFEEERDFAARNFPPEADRRRDDFGGRFGGDDIRGGRRGGGPNRSGKGVFNRLSRSKRGRI